MADVLMERDGVTTEVADNESVTIMEGLGWRLTVTATPVIEADGSLTVALSAEAEEVVDEPTADQAAPAPRRRKRA